MAEKTKKMVEAELIAARETNEGLVEQYNTLMEQAQGIQGQSANRLVFIRLFEGFANDVQRALNKLQGDLAEISAQAQTAIDASDEEEGDA
tara:strand:- start:323 stop:595 length:273 start_codon:yes stop_codon:yes gene_type:complete